MKKFFPIIRVLALFAVFLIAIEVAIDAQEVVEVVKEEGKEPEKEVVQTYAILKYPSVAIISLAFLAVLAFFEYTNSRLDILLRKFLSPEDYKEVTKPLTQQQWFKNLTKAKDISQEEEIILDHNYDGIKELDNDLPPWWVYLFYATMIFACVYFFRFQFLGAENQFQELDNEYKIAEQEIAEFKRNNPNLLTVDNVVELTDPADLEKGKELFMKNCIACHRADGGGAIGPNLTDEYWILGGGIKNVFNTIMEGGRDGKGMVSWKTAIQPADIQKIASYVLTLKGTNPPDAKAPEGEKE